MMLATLFYFLFLKIQYNILSGQAGDGVPSATETIGPSACWKGTTSHTVLYTHTVHRIQESRYCFMSNLNTDKYSTHKHTKALTIVWEYNIFSLKTAGNEE